MAVSASTASALLTVDLRASATSFGAISGGGKSVSVNQGGSGTITLDVWAQVTNAAPVGGAPFGVNQILGSILSTSSNLGATTGSLSLATRLGPYADPSSNAGSLGEFSASYGLGADVIGDVGATNAGTQPTTQVVFSKTGTDSTRGSLVGVAYIISDLAPSTATFQAIVNGYEFKMGTVTLNLANFSAGASVSQNWTFPTITAGNWTLAAQRNKMAIWTEGNNSLSQGGLLTMQVAAPVVITAVPEPSAFGMVLIGALGLVGFRRLGFRRTA